MTVLFPRKLLAGCVFSAALALSVSAPAAELKWKGFDWKLTDGGMAGVADGAAANVSVDANGWLHLRITKTGNTWTASELFTTQKLGFGTYQWHIEGPVDTFDKNNVLGLFPYGPAAGIGVDGTNEIDIEFARWGQANGVNADFADYPNSGKVVGVEAFKFSLGGSTSSTARFTWTNASIESLILKGHQPIASEAELLKKWKYAPANPGVNIPQRAMPLGMNLWCFDAPPSDGKNVEIVIRDFQFVKEGDPLPGSGGMGGGGGTGGGGAAHGGGTASGGVSGAGSSGGGGTGGSLAAGGGQAPTTAGTSSSGAGAVAGSSPTGSGAATGGALAGPTPQAGTSATAGATNATSNDDSGSDAGCACKTGGQAAPAQGALAGLFGLALLALRRRPTR